MSIFDKFKKNKSKDKKTEEVEADSTRELELDQAVEKEAQDSIDEIESTESIDKTREINLESRLAGREGVFDQQEDDFDELTGSHDFQEFNPQQKLPFYKKFFGRLSKKTPPPQHESDSNNQLTRTRIEHQLSGLEKLQDMLQKLKAEEILNTIFSPAFRPKLHQTFFLATLATGSYLIGKTSSLIVASKILKENRATKNAMVASPPRTNYSNELNKVLLSNLFNAKDSYETIVKSPQKPKGPQKPLICDQASKKSSLPYTLINTIVLQDSVKSLASVQVRGKRDTLDLREGEKIQNKAEISRINRLKIIIKNLTSGECEYLETKGSKDKLASKPIKVVSPKAGAKLVSGQRDTRISNEGNQYKIKKSLRDELLSNIGEVLTQARAIQIKNPDGSLAFKMVDIVPGSIYSHLNIQDGDIVEGINGRKFRNLNELMELFNKIKDIDNFQISLKRGGSEQLMEYEFN